MRKKKITKKALYKIKRQQDIQALREVEARETKESSVDLNNEPLLSDDFESTFSSNEPVRDIFTKKNIKFKTDLNEEQRCAISILYDTYQDFLFSWGINITVLKGLLDEYVDFGPSVGRKSRGEFVEAHKAVMAAQAANMNQQKFGQAEQLKTN